MSGTHAKSTLLGRRALLQEVPIEDFYALRVGSIWRQFRREHFSFWMICGYLVFEYVRPQSIISWLDILPWAQVFLLLSIVGWIADSNRKWVSDLANVWIVLFQLVLILASVTAEFPDASWRHFKDFFGWFLIYFLIINIVNTEKRLLVFLAIFLLASFKLSFFGARTWTMRGFAFTDWGLMGPPGFFQNSGELAIQMLMFTPIAYSLAMFMRPYLTKAKFCLLILFPITGAMTVLGASSRGGQIALAYQLYRLLLKGRMSIRTLVAVSIVAAVGWQLLPAEQKERFSSTGSDRTSQQRLLYWKHGLDMIRDQPLLGVGYFNFSLYYEKHYPEDMLYARAELPHNIFIQVGTDAGLLGLSVFGLLLIRNGMCARKIIKVAREDKTKPFAALATGLLIALWGFIVAGQFVTVTYYPFFWVNLAMTVACWNIVRNHYGLATKPTWKENNDSKTAEQGR